MRLPRGRAVAGIAGALALAMAVPRTTLAAEAWVSTGVVDELDGHPTHMVSLALRVGVESNWELAVLRFAGRDRDAGLGGPRTVVTVARRFEFGRLHVLGGVGVNERDDTVLSGHVQCLTGVGARLGPGEVTLRHLSNGSLRGRNRGETWLAYALMFD